MLAQYLETGDLDAAMAILNHPTVTNVTLSEVLTSTSENTRRKYTPPAIPSFTYVITHK